MAISPQKAGRPDPEVEEYEYKDVKWKDFVTKPKYIRGYIEMYRRGGTTDRKNSVVDPVDRRSSPYGPDCITPRSSS